MNGDRFVVELTPLSAASRVATQRRALRWRVISAVISAVIVVVLWLVLRSSVDTAWLVAFTTPWLVFVVIGLVLTVLKLHWAKQDLAAIGQGPAFVVDRTGLHYSYPVERGVEWAQLRSLKIERTVWDRGAGEQLVAYVTDGSTVRVPLSFVNAMPSAIDSAVSALSLGRVRLDASGMDRML